MLPYFVRLVAGGLTKMALCSFMVYSLLMYSPGGPADLFQRIGTHDNMCMGASDYHACMARFTRVIDEPWKFVNPWPVSYFMWLFDPSDTTAIEYKTDREIPSGVDLMIGTLHVRGSGAVTGDFGASWNIEFGRPVADFFGPGIGEMFAFLISLTATLMLVAVVQRWRRPQPNKVSSLPTSSALVDWWQLHATRPIDAAVFRRQWA